MFDFFKKTVKQPPVRDTLFGDLSLEYWASINSKKSPWNLFKEARRNLDKGDKGRAIKVLNDILSLPGLESRHYLQAYDFFYAQGVIPDGDIKIYGVVVEVGMPGGTDLLAVYADHSARYYNYSGRSIIWETADHSLDVAIDDILRQTIDTVVQIRPWRNQRPPAPLNKIARVNFLTSHGLPFIEAPQSDLFRDPLAHKIMYPVLGVRDALIKKTTGMINFN